MLAREAMVVYQCLFLDLPRFKLQIIIYIMMCVGLKCSSVQDGVSYHIIVRDTVVFYIILFLIAPFK